MNGTAPSSKPTLDQRRARHAWERVCEVNGWKGEKPKNYGREAKKLPMRILAAGLGQALAFLLAKAKDAKGKDKIELKALHDHLTDWVIRERPMQAARPESLRDSIIYGDSDFLRRATDESLAYLQWLNRFAEAEGLTADE